MAGLLILALPSLVFGLASDAWEPADNAAAGATAIAPNGSLQHHTIMPGDADWFQFPVVAGKGYTIVTTMTAGGVNVDTYAGLYIGDAATRIAFNDDGNGNFYSRITWVASYTGYAYVKINGYNTSSNGDYAFGVTESTPCITGRS